ncbi:MAG: outer membrane beta-barrel protein [Vicinamibacterales bacterium]
MRPLVVYLVLVVLSLSSQALAQDPPPPIPWVVVDLHGSFPRFPSDNPDLAASRDLDSVAELPGAGLGAQFGLHLYPLHTRIVTVGVGGELAVGRSRQTPVPGTVGADGTPLLATEEKMTSLSPQLSLNFGNGSGWSYLSAGLGATQWSLQPDGVVEYLANSDRLKTLNYGGGARWFIKPHLAFSFDIRFYAISPGFPHDGIPTPRATLFIIGAGISLK